MRGLLTDIAATEGQRSFLCVFRCVFLCFCLGSSPGPARAEQTEPVDFARGLRVEVIDGVPMVRRGDVRAPLTRGRVFGFTADASLTQVELIPDDCWTFGEPELRQFTVDMLEARVENAIALKLHRAGQHAEAAVGFRRALRLDPKFLLASFNLASALNLAAHRAEAAAALAPYLEHKLVYVYLAALQDKELTPLLEEPPFASLKATPPGTAALRQWTPDWIAYSARHERLAVLDAHDGLRVFSLKTGAQDTALQLGDRVLQWSGGSLSREAEQKRRQMEKGAQRVLEKKRPLVNRMLADLGFVEVKQRELGTIKGLPGEQTAQLPVSGLQLTLSDHGLQLVQNGRILREVEHPDGQQRLSRAIWLPSLNTLVWQWSRSSGATDCHRQAGTEVWSTLVGARSR